MDEKVQDLAGERAADYSDETATSASKPFWNLYTCCGCVVGLFVLLAIGSAITMSIAIRKTFPAEPLEFEPISYAEEELNAANRKLARIEAGEEVVLTARELEVVWQDLMEQSRELDETKVRVEISEDSKARFRMSAKMVGSGSTSGRYINCDVTVSGSIEKGKGRQIKIEEMLFGGWDIPDSLLDSTWQSMEREASVNTSNVQTFRIENGQFVIAIDADHTGTDESDAGDEGSGTATESAEDTTGAEPQPEDPAPEDPAKDD